MEEQNQPLCNGTHYNTVLDINGHVLAPKWSFFYSFYVKLHRYNMVHL